MTDIKFSSDFGVKYIQHMGSDQMICQAAKVSEQALAAQDAAESERLIKFLADNRHGTPFEHTAMTFMITEPIFVTREFHRHRVGWCVAGSTKIPVGPYSNWKSIADIYRDWHEGVPDVLGRAPRKLASARNLITRTVNLDNGLIEHTRMTDVFKSGVKSIIQIKLASGETLRCTKDHQLYSPEGWVKAGDVQVNDLLGRQGKVVTGEPIGIPQRLREGIQFWTTEQRVKIAAIDSCYQCGGLFAKEELELDHVIPVVESIKLALDGANLLPICKPCHRTKTNAEQVLARRRPQTVGLKFDRVILVKSDGEEMTYDIEMPGPWHNFIADGFVVHNSYNEESSRWRQMEPHFYIPPKKRPTKQIGRTGEYKLVVDEDDINWNTFTPLRESEARRAYEVYEAQLRAGVAREVARQVLPVNLYTSFFATCNARSLMHFLSLRMDETALWEIRQVANQAFNIFEELFPFTANAFAEAGRIAP